MSNEYIEIEVSKGTAEFLQKFMIVVVIVGVVTLILAAITQNMGMLIFSVMLMAIAPIIYGIIALVSNMRLTSSNNEVMKRFLFIFGMIVGSLGFLFILLLILGGI